MKNCGINFVTNNDGGFIVIIRGWWWWQGYIFIYIYIYIRKLIIDILQSQYESLYNQKWEERTKKIEAKNIPCFQYFDNPER